MGELCYNSAIVLHRPAVFFGEGILHFSTSGSFLNGSITAAFK